MRHESMMQAYRLLVPYVFTADKDDPHVLIAQDRNYEDMLHARIRFKRNPENFLDVWHIIQRHPAWPPSFYMYDDDPGSRDDYWERLGKLYAHKHVIVEWRVAHAPQTGGDLSDMTIREVWR